MSPNLFYICTIAALIDTSLEFISQMVNNKVATVKQENMICILRHFQELFHSIYAQVREILPRIEHCD